MRKSVLGVLAAAALRFWAAALCFLAAALGGGASLLADEGDGDLFAKLDANKDGFVAADEVGDEQKPLFERLLRNADKDEDKKLSKDEFAAGLKPDDAPKQPLGAPGGPGRPGGGAPDPKEAFARLDTDKDGKISKDEAQGPIRQGFERMDANSDGFVDEVELTQAIARFTGRPPQGDAGARPDPRQAEELFAKADANGDGKITKDEIPEDKREQFGRMLERIGSDSATKEQFVRAMMFMAQLGRPEIARPDGRPGEGRLPLPDGAFPGRRPPLITALDTDEDGELSASEIEAASKSLAKLDKNSDGKLTPEELFPMPPPDGAVPPRPGAGRPEAARPDGPRPEGRPGERRPGAGRPGGNPAEFLERLKAADANGDGKLSKEEAPEFLKERFDRIDANSDGAIDEAEVRQMVQRFREAGGNRPEGRRPEGRPEGARPEGRREEGVPRPDQPKPE